MEKINRRGAEITEVVKKLISSLCSRRHRGESSSAFLKLRTPWCARKGDDVADIFQTGEIHHHALKTEAETRVGHRAVAAQVEIPPIRFLIQTAVAQSLG